MRKNNNFFIVLAFKLFTKLKIARVCIYICIYDHVVGTYNVGKIYSII